MLAGKRILLGVTGSIAAYKAVELLRDLVKAGADVTVAMTASAERFVAPLTFATLSGRPVLSDLYTLDYQSRIGHIAATERADLFLVAPATANTIAKFAHGLADDFLGNLYLANTAPVLIAPAMDADMYRHPATQENLERLKARGVHIVGPAVGELASGIVGPGRLADVPEILRAVEEILAGPQAGARDLAGQGIPRADLIGQVVLVTAGPTREALDPVRFLSNRSSGKMGYALAEAARDRGAGVILVSGPTALAPPHGVPVIRVESTQEMFDAVMARLGEATVVIKAAAVADYRPKRIAPSKIKKADEIPTVELEPTPDILAEVGRRKGGRVLVGFAAETENVVANAARKLERKSLDLVVANDVRAEGAGFDADTNIVTLVGPGVAAETLPRLTKRQVADRVLDRVVELLAR